MTPDSLADAAQSKIQTDSELTARHLEYMKRMVAVESRSFGVNEYPGDRETPTDMRDILQLAGEYLRDVGFQNIRVNEPAPGPVRATPILMAEIRAGDEKPTVLLYAHLDKQPYMDDAQFNKWGGTPPWELRWNEDKTRAYGRGAADDLSGVVAIGMAVDALLRSLGGAPDSLNEDALLRLPCNVKVVFETEEESGSATLIEQILQNREFFSSCDCVIITDVVNPATGVPGLTTSLRGIVQTYVSLKSVGGGQSMDAATALYKMLASLTDGDQSLAVEKIVRADAPVTDEERIGLEKVPTSVAALREMAGLLPEILLTVPEDKVEMLVAQLRKSYANARPGHRVCGGVILGIAGARLGFKLKPGSAGDVLTARLRETIDALNPFRLKVGLNKVSGGEGDEFRLDLIVQSATKDPHSGVNGGPFPVPEMQLAKMIVGIAGAVLTLEEFIEVSDGHPAMKVESLFADQEGAVQLFENKTAKALVEIRLAPGNDEEQAREFLKKHLRANTPQGFTAEFDDDKGGPPWMSGIDHPAFSKMLASLEAGFQTPACLYGCGGSIPFVGKLMDALGEIPPLCIGAYDSDCQMHEPNESLSMKDLLGCARSIAHFISHIEKAFPNS